MAGDWIKIEHVLPDKPEVWAIAQTLGMDGDAVVGKLLRVWIWADQHTRPGQEINVPAAWLDVLTKTPGFADALRKVNWLAGRDNALIFPGLDRHVGQTAKIRSQAAERQSKCRDVREVELVSQLGHNAVTKSDARQLARKAIIPRPLRRHVYDRDARRCVYCGSQEGQWFVTSGNVVLSLDHVVPESKGGETQASNLVTACMPCNQQKSGRSLSEAGMEISYGTPATELEVTSCDRVVTTALPEVEKRREDIKGVNPLKPPGNETDLPPPEPDAKFQDGMIPVPKALDTPAFNEAWTAWIRHLRTLLAGRVSQDGLTRSLVALANKGPEKAVAMIDNAIANQWRSLQEPKEERRGRVQGAGVHYDASRELDPL